MTATYSKGSHHHFFGQHVEVLIEASAIASRIAELSRHIEADYHQKELVVVGVLKGSFIFMADLVRSLKLPLTCDFVHVASYAGDRSDGVVRMDFDMTQPIADKDVLLIEDIVDSGTTLRYLLSHLESKGARSLKVASLLFKETGTESRRLIDYLAFEVPHRFVVGYGLDFKGKFRSLPFIGAFASS